MRPVLAHHKCPTHTSFPFYSVLSGNRTTISPPLKRLSRQSLFFHHNHKLQASLILQISKCIYEFFTTHYQVNPLEAKTNLDSSHSCCWLKTPSFSHKLTRVTSNHVLIMSVVYKSLHATISV
jgi:hypothetical protein